MKGTFQQSKPSIMLQEEIAQENNKPNPHLAKFYKIKCGNCGHKFYKDKKQKFCNKCFRPIIIVKNNINTIDTKLLKHIKNFRIDKDDMETRMKLYELLLLDIEKINKEKLGSNCAINKEGKERLLFCLGFTKGMAYSNYKIGNKLVNGFKKDFC